MSRTVTVATVAGSTHSAVCHIWVSVPLHPPSPIPSPLIAPYSDFNNFQLQPCFCMQMFNFLTVMILWFKDMNVFNFHFSQITDRRGGGGVHICACHVYCSDHEELVTVSCGWETRRFLKPQWCIWPPDGVCRRCCRFAEENERGGREQLHSCGARSIHLHKHRQ